jgi:hypothetical protein
MWFRNPFGRRSKGGPPAARGTRHSLGGSPDPRSRRLRDGSVQQSPDSAVDGRFPVFHLRRCGASGSTRPRPAVLSDFSQTPMSTEAVSCDAPSCGGLRNVEA